MKDDVDDEKLAEEMELTTLRASGGRESVRALRMRGQEARRAEALALQRQQRRDLTAHARSLATTTTPPPLPEPSEPSVRKKSLFADQLMRGETLNEVPHDCGEAWVAVPLPQNGVRCLVSAAFGSTVARRMTGSVISRFSSALPNGGAASASAERGKAQRTCTLLDCVLEEASATFYVRDVMCWKDYLLYDCDTDFRFFWRDTKLAETNAAVRDAGPHGGNPYVFVPLPTFPATREGLQSAAAVPNAAAIAIYHRQTHYTFGDAPTPLVCECPLSAAPSLLFQPLS